MIIYYLNFLSTIRKRENIGAIFIKKCPKINTDADVYEFFAFCDKLIESLEE
jgi:hypothetical protein